MPKLSFPYASGEEIREGRLLAWLSYPGIIFGLLGLLFLVPMFAQKENPFTRYHARQGMFLFLASVLVTVFFWVVCGVILEPIIDLSPVAGIATAIGGMVVFTGIGITIYVFAIIGTVKAASGKFYRMPLIGTMAERWFPNMVPQTSSQTPRRDKMYCRNCGKELPASAEFCISCGVRALNAENFCQNCGAKTNPQQEVCLKCGTLLKREEKHEPLGRKNKLIALLLCLFLAPLGVHRYYMGRVGNGVAMLLLYFSIFVFLFMGAIRSLPEPVWIGLLVFGAFALVGYMVWWIIDLISIATGKMKDRQGRKLGETW
jgi:uncharacterized membrane protein/ribosomal protein L40E